MKIAAKFLTALAIMILFASGVEAADLQVDSEKVFVARKILLPPRLRQPFPPSIRTPKKDYPSRVPLRPTPRHLPNLPKTTYDDRGGKRKNFGPPQAKHR